MGIWKKLLRSLSALSRTAEATRATTLRRTPVLLGVGYSWHAL